MQLVRGIVSVLPTPLNPDETVDVAAARKLTAHVLASGVNAIWVLGTGGEIAMLRDCEKQRMVEAVVGETAGHVPVIAGVSAASTTRALDNVREVVAVGANAVHVLPPFFLTPNQSEAKDFYQRLADSSPVPLIIYQNPGISKMAVSLDTIVKLAEHPRVIGIKDSSGDMKFFQTLCNATQTFDHFALLQGSEQLVYLSLKSGGVGSVGSLTFIVPHLYTGIFQSERDGDDKCARQFQARLTSLARVVFGCANAVGAIKYIASLLGLCQPVVAHPYHLPSESEKHRLLAELKKQGLAQSQ